MHRAKKVTAAVLTLLLVLIILPTANGQANGKADKREENFDPVAFIKQFKIGMSYTEVQEALPKNVNQDILSYIVPDELFVLSVDIPVRGDWSATFKFDTLDTPMRRPEQLVELSCSAGLSGRNDSFESIVRKVNAVFGEPVKLDRTQDKVQQAGWRMSGGSILTLEYAVVSGGLSGNNVSVDFIIKRKKLPQSSKTKTFA